MIVYVVLLVIIIMVRTVQTSGKFAANKGNEIPEYQAGLDKKFLFAAFSCIILLTAVRSVDVGPDTKQYVDHFNRTCDGVYYALDEQFEWGYRLLTLALSKITRNAQVLLALVALITNIPVARFIYKYSRNKLLSVILYITIGSFTFQLTGLRQSIAMAVCVIAIDFALSRKPIPFVALIVLAALFHRSALMFLPVYFIGSPKLNRKSLLLVALSLVGVFYADVLFEKLSILLSYEEYVGTTGVNNSGGWTLMAIMLIALVLYLVAWKIDPIEEEKENKERFFFILVLIALSLYLARYQVRVAERVSLYYRMALIVLLPNSLLRLKNEKLSLILNIVCGVLAIALFFYWLLGSFYIYSPFWSFD